MGGCAFLLAACFEDPIEERCTLRVEPTGEVRVTIETVVNRPLGGNRQFDERLAALEQELLGGYGPWQQRFERVGGDRDGLAWERWETHLVRFEQWAQLEEPERQLVELFGDTPVDVRLVRGEGTSELTLFAGPSDRATRRERERVDDALRAWADDVAEYYAATAVLWRYFEAHPDRAFDVMSVLADEIPEGNPDQIDLLSEEEPMVQRAQEAQQRVVEIFDFEEDEAYTLQEISRRVFDPFPAAFAVELPEGGRLLEHDGFELDEDGRLLVPRVSFWEAFETLEGRWLSPDPLLAQARHWLRERHTDAPFPVAAFLDQEFGYAVTAPRGTEIGSLLRRALRPRELYRAVWATPPEAASDTPD